MNYLKSAYKKGGKIEKFQKGRTINGVYTDPFDDPSWNPE